MQLCTFHILVALDNYLLQRRSTRGRGPSRLGETWLLPSSMAVWTRILSGYALAAGAQSRIAWTVGDATGPWQLVRRAGAAGPDWGINPARRCRAGGGVPGHGPRGVSVHAARVPLGAFAPGARGAQHWALVCAGSMVMPLNRVQRPRNSSCSVVSRARASGSRARR
jgi:hypothetical protein